MKKKSVTGRVDVRVRLRPLIDEALDRALAYASRRAFKHRSEAIATPDELASAIVENLGDEFWRVLSELGVEVA